jgi:hypothetical protein
MAGNLPLNMTIKLNDASAMALSTAQAGHATATN